MISDSNFLQQDKTIEWIIFTKTFGKETYTDFTPFLVDFKMIFIHGQVFDKCHHFTLKSVFDLSINT